MTTRMRVPLERNTRWGNWNGQQLLPAWFVDEAARNQAPGIGRSTFLHTRYGLYWRTNDLLPNNHRPWPSAPPKTYMSHGNSCNFCVVIPEWNMVIVRLGTQPVGSIADTGAKWDAFFAQVGNAVQAWP
jgi:CubicO group peptidase (beta-lactamase class C family)